MRNVNERIHLVVSDGLFNLFGRLVCTEVLNDLLPWESFLFRTNFSCFYLVRLVWTLNALFILNRQDIKGIINLRSTFPPPWLDCQSLVCEVGGLLKHDHRKSGCSTPHFALTRSRVQILVRRPPILTENTRSFGHSLQTDARTAHQIRPWPHSTSFSNNHTLIILPPHATCLQTQLLAAAVSNQEYRDTRCARGSGRGLISEYVTTFSVGSEYNNGSAQPNFEPGNYQTHVRTDEIDRKFNWFHCLHRSSQQATSGLPGFESHESNDTHASSDVTPKLHKYFVSLSQFPSFLLVFTRVLSFYLSSVLSSSFTSLLFLFSILDRYSFLSFYSRFFVLLSLLLASPSRLSLRASPRTRSKHELGLIPHPRCRTASLNKDLENLYNKWDGSSYRAQPVLAHVQLHS